VSSVFETLMLWLLLAVAVMMVVLSARARRLEREEGLASSGKRLVATSLICAAVTLLVLGATASALFPPSSAPSVVRPSAEPTDPVVAARKEKLDRRKAELYAELDRIDAEIAGLLPEEKAPTSAGRPTSSCRSW
jgi:4-amino-4-deoxy-L-arabinose transferase-like glycosyltransferase